MTTLLNDVLGPTKLVTIGIVIGAVSGLTIAQFNPGPTLAAVTANPPFNIGSALDDAHLAKFDGNYYAIETASGVSLQPQSQVTVRKIGYGQTSFVTVATTSTGVYSSDGLASPHIRYPGIYVAPVEVHAFPLTGTVLGWSRLGGWTQIPLLSADSFGFLDSVAPPASQAGVCVRDTDTGACR